MDDFNETILRIDLSALVANYDIIRRRTGPADVAAVVKADAYGLGAVAVTDTLSDQGCKHFFVATLAEAKALKCGMRDRSAAVYVLNGLQPQAEDECAAIGAIPVLNSLDQIGRWAATARSRGCELPAVLQVDTGMSRLGLSGDEASLLLNERDRLSGIGLQMIMTHLACADDPRSGFNQVQAGGFEAFCAQFPSVRRSLDNSGGAFLNRDHFDIVRAGIALYGGAPNDEPNPMWPVVSLYAGIIQLRTIAAGTGVGYGLTHCATRPSHIATLAIGYADGWPRHLSGKGWGFIGGIRVPIIGRVSMDSISVDVTGVPDCLLFPGAHVQLIGPNQTIDEVAADAGTISYEILTQLGHRYAREYIPARAAAFERSLNL